MPKTIETWTFVGGPADGKRHAMREPRDTILIDTTVMPPLRPVPPSEDKPAVRHRRSTVAYHRHPLHFESGDILYFYIADGISDIEAFRMLFERYTEARS